MPKRRNRGVPQVESRGDGVLSEVDQCGMNSQEGKQPQLHHGVIGFPPQQPERGAQAAFQFANPEVEELAEQER